ncbi:MAG TPA: phosphate ABC transporter substrate-binding protein [Ktedonobacteraceae bacterium]|nr:phosphate ABC transporter substrate-binding protein [Ktedonobacteraceae bacterium]
MIGTISMMKRIARTYIPGNFSHSSLQATLLTIVLILLVSCGVYKNASGSTTSAPSAHVHIIGSTALLPLVTKAADLFSQQHSDIKIDTEGSGSIAGLDAVTQHQADIGDSDIPADPSKYSDPNLTDHIVCENIFTLIINPQIDLTSLTTQQASNIFTGVITNWKDVGGPNLAISPVIRPATSGTRALFDKYILGGASEAGNPLTSDSSTTVLDTVAHTPGGISYVTTTLVNPTVKAIGLDGISATEQNIKSGTYRFWGFEHMYTLQNGVNATTSFLDFMQTPQIQQLAQNLGYIPVTNTQT